MCWKELDQNFEDLSWALGGGVKYFFARKAKKLIRSPDCAPVVLLGRPLPVERRRSKGSGDKGAVAPTEMKDEPGL